MVENRYIERAINVDSTEYRSIAADISYTGVASNTSYTNLTNDQWKSDFAQYHTMAYSELVLVFDDYRYINKPFDASEPRREKFTPYGNGPVFGKTYTMAEPVSLLDWLSQSAQVAQPELEMHVVHASARYATSRSRIQLSLHYLIVVIAANVFKLFIMATVLAMDHGHSKYIVTLGDAAASFLERPDPCTEGKCLLEDENLIAEVDGPTATPKADLERATSIAGDPALPKIKSGWHKRTLGYYASTRNEQSWFTFFG